MSQPAMLSSVGISHLDKLPSYLHFFEKQISVGILLNEKKIFIIQYSIITAPSSSVLKTMQPYESSLSSVEGAGWP